MTIEDLLIARSIAEERPDFNTDPNLLNALAAAQVAENQRTPSMLEAAGIGGTIGAVALGNPVGQAQALFRGKKPGQAKRDPRLKPGGRMAGALVGAILGGSLGAGTREMAIQSSPAAALLAKAQVGGLTSEDAAMLQSVLKDTYSQMGIV